MKNAYAKEQAELRRHLLNYGALVGQQFNVDMMCLALNEEGFGHDRIMRIIHRAEKHGEYFHECLAYGVESDARFEQLDQRLRYICRDHPEDFVPREERYPNVKVPGMGKTAKPPLPDIPAAKGVSRPEPKPTEIKLPLAVGQATPRFAGKASSEKADIFARLNRYWSEKGPGSMIKLSEACGLDASKLYLMQRNDGKFDIEHWRAVNAGLDKLGYGGMK